jgi:hypothetical protein
MKTLHSPVFSSLINGLQDNMVNGYPLDRYVGTARHLASARYA